MFRRGIILATIVAVVIGSVGFPTNVHSCAMKKEETVSSTCGMCSRAHAEESHDSGSGRCCDNRIEFQHTDPASSVKAGVAVPAPAILAVLVWYAISFEPVSAHHSFVSLRSHSPPVGLRQQASYLFNSSFLI